MTTLTKDELEALASKWEKLATEYDGYYDTRTSLVLRECATELRSALAKLASAEVDKVVAYLGVAKGKDKARHPIGKSLAFPDSPMPSNLNWVPLTRARSAKEA